jgi:hypothetical protein
MHRLIQEELIKFTEDQFKYESKLEKNEDLLNYAIYYINKTFIYGGYTRKCIIK